MMKGDIGEEDQGRHRGVVLKRKKSSQNDNAELVVNINTMKLAIQSQPTVSRELQLEFALLVRETRQRERRQRQQQQLCQECCSNAQRSRCGSGQMALKSSGSGFAEDQKKALQQEGSETGMLENYQALQAPTKQTFHHAIRRAR